ncbi:MAG: hypothetical protein HLUCCA01_06890 [Bacteroidetes bacterium HLUCCA01]|nr:MAG: hypothetical protein HLUCCA01_06890 [Bacteroidetes bacterium HLUCCA01]
MRSTILFMVIVFSWPWAMQAQFTPNPSGPDINFGQYYSTSATITAINPDLLFGPVIAGQPPKEVEIDSGDAAILEIEGLPFLDVIIEITGAGLTINNGFLYLDGDAACTTVDCRIPVTYGFAFDNSGGTMPDATQAVDFTINPVLYPMTRRTAGAPPGPPPTPEIAGVNLPAAVSTFLFIYGTITSDPANQAGAYESTLTIEVTYN